MFSAGMALGMDRHCHAVVFSRSRQPAENDQPTPEGGLTIKNLDTGSADLRTIPGVIPSPDDAKAEADVEAVFADPSHKEFKSTEKAPRT
jgi:hypothetical protein